MAIALSDGINIRISVWAINFYNFTIWRETVPMVLIFCMGCIYNYQEY